MKVIDGCFSIRFFERKGVLPILTIDLLTI